MSVQKTVLIVCDSYRDMDGFSEAFRGIDGVHVCHLFQTRGYRADVILWKQNSLLFKDMNYANYREACQCLPNRLKPGGKILTL